MGRTRNKFWSFFISISFFAFGKKRPGVTPPQLSLSSSEELFSADEGVSKISATSNSEGNTVSSPLWFAATVFVTEGNGEFYLNIQPNAVNTFYLTGLRQCYN
jgi:hypothetical protein